MFKNRTANGRNNIVGEKVENLRKSLKGTPSQRQFAELLQVSGLDIDKNAIQRIESGERFVTDIELKVFAAVLGVTYEELLK
ncbi:MAG: helix-turn-helix domain-containing protein [Defluviitaleaceae bacterium]|nr:helix-turn-helix domain-containing protein [Defluviitaleaceae bacterium]